MFLRVFKRLLLSGWSKNRRWVLTTLFQMTNGSWKENKPSKKDCLQETTHLSIMPTKYLSCKKTCTVLRTIVMFLWSRCLQWNLTKVIYRWILQLRKILPIVNRHQQCLVDVSRYLRVQMHLSWNIPIWTSSNLLRTMGTKESQQESTWWNGSENRHMI